ncbi:hypothetical protein HZB60_06355 [candidate division KSB1 bacterium]|nr:hypothetical protein [candidate division KSB1 bacterium]
MTMTRMRSHFAVLLIVLLAVCQPARAGLRDIYPRPQQMGLISESPVFIPGSFYLVLPTNPTAEENWIKDALVTAIEQKTFRRPTVIYAHEADGQYPAIWLGTAARFPALAAALDSTEIDGLGQFTHAEEYQIYVSDNRILVGGGDMPGVRWGTMSLPYLFAESNGNLYVDRAYIRDWPFWNKRIATLNSSIRDATQRDYCNTIVDNARLARFNEIEWNSSDAGNDLFGRPQVLIDGLALRNKITQFGMKLTMSCDRVGIEVYDPSWQEGVPCSGTKMLVGATAFTPITNGFNLALGNGNFESWTANRPNSYTANPEASLTYVSRDQVVKHGGTSAVKWTGFTPTLPGSLELQQNMYVGSHRWMKAKIWYRTDHFTGRIRFKIFGPPPVVSGCDFREIVCYDDTRGWTLWEIKFATFNVDTALILAGPDVATGGTMWLDDITFETTDPVAVVRRSETPLQVFKLPSNQLMIEGYDYQVIETNSVSWANFCQLPRFERLAGGRLNSGDSVTVNYYSAVPYESAKQTVCCTNLPSLQNYQRRVRNLDSLFRPDGFKIHINEMSFAGYDPSCLASGLTPAQLVGSYCAQMYQIIQAQRPGAPVRIYGDPFDIWGRDPRAMPVQSIPWNVGGLQMLPAPIEMMNQAQYTTNVDSAFAYFAANGHPSVIAMDGGQMDMGSVGFALNRQSVIKATQYPSCRGLQFYDWVLALNEQLGVHGGMAWNMGPYFVHSPLTLQPGQGSATILADIWSDTLRQADTIPAIPQRLVRYRLLPSGTWQQTTLAAVGTDAFSATVNLAGSTGIEYYLEATDHRGLTKTCPAEAPARTFHALLPISSGPAIVPDREEVEYRIAALGGYPLIEWEAAHDVKLYEVRLASSDAQKPTAMELVSRQSPQSPRFVFADARFAGLSLENVHVYAIRDAGGKQREVR